MDLIQLNFNKPYELLNLYSLLEFHVEQFIDVF